MTLLRRQPRAVYRVYSEDEYLAGADSLIDWEAPVAADREAPVMSALDVPAAADRGAPVAAAGWEAPVAADREAPVASDGVAPMAEPTVHPPSPSASPQRCSRERRLRRLAGAAALTGAVGTVGGTIAVVGLRSHPAARRIAANLPMAPHAAPSTVVRSYSDSSASPVRGARPSTAIDGKGVVVGEGIRVVGQGSRQKLADHHRSTPITRRRGSHSDMGAGMHVTVTGTPQTAPVASRALTRAPSSSVAEPQSAQVTQAPVANTVPSASAEAPAGTEAQGEFGFERRDG
jgi:hypothetical protein